MAAAIPDDTFKCAECSDPLDCDSQDHLRSNLDYLTRNLDVAPLLQILYQKNEIDIDTRDNIKAEPTPTRQADALIDVINRGSQERFTAFLHALETSKQYEVLRVVKTIPKDKGAVVTIHSRLLALLKAKEAAVIENLRFEGSLLLHLVANDVITENQREHLQAIASRLDRAEALVLALERGGNDERMEKFAKVLDEVGQKHISTAILGQGDSDILSTNQKQKMRPDMVKYVYGLKEIGTVDNFRELVQNGVITAAQMEEVHHRHTSNEKAELLLDILMCRPYSALKELKRSMETAAGPGALVRISGQLGLSEPSRDSSPGISHTRFTLISGGTCYMDEPIYDNIEAVQKRFAIFKPDLGGARGTRLEEPATTGGARGTRLEEPAAKGPHEYDNSTENKYRGATKRFQRQQSRSSNYQIQREFGLNIGKAVFFIALLIVPKSILHQGEEELEQGFGRQQAMSVDMQTLFDPDPRGYRPHRVLVLGTAGAGKSTLLQYACEQWGLGALWKQFKYIFNLTCRRLNQMVENKTKINILDLLLKHGPQAPKEEEEMLRKDILSNLEHVLIVIDGTDELSGWIEFCPEDVLPIRDIQEPAGILELVHSLIVGDLLRESSVLITSRPIDKFDHTLFDKTIKIFGFDRKSIERCLLALAKENVDDLKAALKYLDQRPQLYSFCTLPLGCIMTGRVVLDEISYGSKDHVKYEAINCATLLYVFVLLVFLNRRGQQTTRIMDRFEGVFVWCKTLLKMMKLAAWGMLQSSPCIIFGSQVLRDHSIDTEDLLCGLLNINTDDKDDTLKADYTSAAFVHFSIQEFLAALHIAITWKSADIKLITSRKSTHQFNSVLLYLSGLLGNPLGKKLIRIIDESIPETRLDKQLTKLFDTLVMEYRGRFKFLPTVTKEGKNSGKLMTLQLLRCIGEGNNPDLVKKIDGLVLKAGNLDLTNMPGGLLPEYMPAIAFYLQWSEKVTALRLEPSYCCSLVRIKTPESEGRLGAMLDTALLQSGHLDLQGLQLSEDDVIGLVTFVLSTQSLKSVDKYTSIQLMRGITPENHDLLLPLLDSAALKSGVIDMMHIQLSNEDVAGLVRYVLHTKSLRRIEMYTAAQLMRGITPENQEKLVPILDTSLLQSGSLNLRGINLSSNDIAGLAIYAMYTKSCKRVEKYTGVQLMRGITADNQARLVPMLDLRMLGRWEDAGQVPGWGLDLSDNPLAEVDVMGLTFYLLHSRRITHLRLYNCGVTDVGVQLIANALDFNHSLEELGLSSSKITDIGARSMATALKTNASLKTFRLYRCCVTDIGAEYMASMLEINGNLEVLDLAANGITCDGANSLEAALRMNNTLTHLSLQWNGLSSGKIKQMRREFHDRVGL